MSTSKETQIEMSSRSLHKGPRDVATLTTGNIVVGSYRDGVKLYTADVTEICTLDVPNDVTHWSPRWLSTTVNDDIIVGSCSSIDDGGGLYSYSADGEYMKKLLAFNYPRGLATSEYRLIILSEHNHWNSFIDIYDMMSYVNTGLELHHRKRRVCERDLLDANNVAINPVTNGIIICHDTGVTCFDSDLNERWVHRNADGYIRRGGGVIVNSNGFIYVADVSENGVCKLSPGGEYVKSFKMHSNYGLSGLAVDSNERLLVVNNNTSTLYVIKKEIFDTM